MIDKQKMNRNLDALGFKESTPGTEYIRMGIQMVDENRQAMMCKEIYPGIARATGRTAGSIERAMRTAVDAAARSPHFNEAWAEMGGWGHPTNGEIIRRLARESYED